MTKIEVLRLFLLSKKKSLRILLEIEDDLRILIVAEDKNSYLYTNIWLVFSLFDHISISLSSTHILIFQNI